MARILTSCWLCLLLFSPVLGQPDLKSEFLEPLNVVNATQVSEGRAKRARYLLFSIPDSTSPLQQMRKALPSSGWEFETEEFSKVQKFAWVESRSEDSEETTETRLILRNVKTQRASRIRGMGCDILYENVIFSVGTVVNEDSPHHERRVLLIKQWTRIG